MRMPSASRPSGSRSNGMPSSGGSRSYSAQQPPRSAMKGARASTSARPSLPASNQSRTSLGKRRATQEEEDDAEADRIEDESVVDLSVDPLLPDSSFADRSPMRADKSVSFKQLPANSSSRKSLKDTSNRKQTNITQFSTGKRSGPVPPSAASRSQDDEPRRKKSRQSSPPRPPPKDTEKARKRREAEKQRDKERAEAKRAAAAINERSKKRRRAVGDEDGDEDEDDGDPEYEVEFEDDDEDGGAGPDTTLQEEVIIGARMAKDTRRINGQTAKLMRKRLRRAIRLALAEDPDNVLDDADESGGAPARKRRSTGADKLTDADVIWSVLDAELKAASTSQASSIASSTLRELRKIIRTLFEGLSVKASERRELISQLERARSRKKRIRREVFEARRIVLENEEEINRIKEESVDSANRAKVSRSRARMSTAILIVYFLHHLADCRRQPLILSKT